jgi:hypothetical protein
MNSDLEQVWGWLQNWWKRAGDIVTNYDLSPPVDPWAWDGWVSAGVFRIPSAVAGIETAPFVELLKAIVSLWEPGPEIGPRRTKEDLWALSSAAWTAYNRLQALKIAAAELESEDSPTEAAEGATQPAGGSIAEAPQRSPERAAAANPGSTPSGPTASPVALQGASGEVVQWSNPRPRKAWLNLLAELEHPPFTGETAWKKHIQRDPDSFSVSARLRKITRAKAEEWGLRLPEFDGDSK